MTSPSVKTFERDKSFYIQNVVSAASGYVGLFRWGPVNEAIHINTNEDELLQKLGRPNNTVSGFFHAAANYLKYSSPLIIVRAIDDLVAKNATSDGLGQLILNEADYEQIGTGLEGVAFVAKYPGELGNSLKVSICDSTGFANWDYAGEFDYAPEAGEYNLVVIDEDGLFSGVAGRVLERYELMTLTAGAKKSDGTSAYLPRVLQEQSQFIYLGDELALDFTQSGSEGIYEVSLTGGVDGNDVLTADFTTAVQVFSNKETIDLYSMYSSFLPSAVVKQMIDLADSREDCKTFFAPELSDVYNNPTALSDVTEYFNNTINVNTSYGFGVDNWKLVYDKYNDKNIWIPCDSDAAGLEAQTFARNEPWYSFAGLNRGQLKNVIKLAWNPDEKTRDVLYKSNINSIVSFPGEGTVLFGDKTMLKRPSAFSRVNVRNLFIVIKKNIANAARYQLFEFNDVFTRGTFKNATDRYLDQVQGRRGIRRKLVICDESNNTPQVIDANEFVGTIMIDPARSINNIRLNFVAVGAGVSFEEIEGESF